MESKFEVDIQYNCTHRRDLTCDISLAPVSDSVGQVSDFANILGEVLVELSLKALVAWLAPTRSPQGLGAYAI